MKTKRLLPWMLVAVLVFTVNCSSEDEVLLSDNQTMTEEKVPTEAAKAASKTIVGEWRLIADGLNNQDVEELKEAVVFYPDGKGLYQFRIGEADYKTDEFTYVVNNNWKLFPDNGQMEGDVTFYDWRDWEGETVYCCDIIGEELYIGSEPKGDGTYRVMPARFKTYKRVK